uniref:Anamorsin homolog n=1 Tax=Craspedostauros australis TaxID=1486917 RepID=A0A7R9WQG7_9STRA|eukprot:CAMPEP_0198108842 /NCGR_PEP_ID=MMETSP1442-20131203/873_1 /TAXON_ID= /ORGANISM="Craspedostauros australis, Strain CCMP3328" /LENGTH=264 /DNA_ID=CAMNT_0043764235 /DNA_START=94 /DNA_END=888 /DNA_ORIENTATION=-
MSSTTTSLRLILGNAAPPAAPAGEMKTVTATTAEEVASSRSNMGVASLDELEITVASSDIGASGLYGPMELASWSSLLKPTSTVSIRIVGDAAESALKTVHTSFLLAGLASKSERREQDSVRVLKAAKKSISNASAAPLQTKKPRGPAVTISLDDALGDDDGLIDEDGLLTDENNLLAPPPAMSASSKADDCAGRKPCDDCTCGRAEREGTSTAKDKAPKQAPSSSCGKCGMGDAFRCASCPYLGKPAFKAGEEHLVLNLDDDL